MRKSINLITPRERWYIKNYKETYTVFPTSDKIKKYINDPKNDHFYLYGEYNRCKTLISFAYYIDIDIVNTICIAFKIKDSISDIDATFSLAYFEMTHRRENIKLKTYDKSGYQIPGSSTKSRYFTIGPSYSSKDGEYRAGMISYDNINIIKSTPIIQNIFQDIFEYINKKSIQRGWVFLKEYFFPTDEKKIIQNELEYNSFQIQFELFNLTWFNTMYNLYLNFVENHINNKFKKIMFKHSKEDLVFFKSLIKKYSIEQMELLRYLSNNVLTGKVLKSRSKNKIGQKIIPLSIAEAQNPFDIRYKPWCEYLISLYLSDFIVNKISPGFFITNSWFYIKNSRKGLYDNDIQYEKMHRSDLAIQITELLTRAQIYTQENIINKKKLNKTINKTINTYISEKFKILHNKIQDPVDYAKEEIIMSNVTLCIISEYVGRTIWDVILSSKTSNYYNKLIGEPFSLAGYPIFTKYMFELCYNLYCMNSIAGIIHGDLHLNNATINSINYNSSTRNINDIKDPREMYIIGDENEQYIFKTTGYFLCLIDFSRSIILPEKIGNFIDPSLPKTFNTNKDMKQFYIDQSERLLRIYLNYTSDNESQRDDLIILFKNSFEAVFKLLTSLDVFGFTDKLLKLFRVNDSSIIKPHINCIKLLERLNKISQRFFIEEMNNLIANKSYEKTVLEMEWPLQIIIKNCFYENSIFNTDTGEIINIFNCNNKLKYSLNKLNKYPPVVSCFKEIINNKEISKDNTDFIKLRKNFEKEKEKGIKTVNFIASRQRQKHL